MKYLQTILGIILIYSGLAPLYSNRSCFYHYMVGPVISAIVIPIVMLISLLLIIRHREQIMNLLGQIAGKFTFEKVMLLALMLRVLWILLVDHSPNIDLDWHNAIALDIINGGDWLRPDKPPGTGIITALFYKLFGVNRIVAMLPQLIASMLEIGLVYKIAKKMAGETAGLLAALILAIYPEHIFFANLVNSDNLFSVLVLTAAFVMFYPEKVKWYHALITGLVLGIAQYVRPIATLTIGVMVLVVVIMERKNILNGMGHGLMMIMVFLIVLVPIMRFNQVYYGNISLSPSKQLGWSLLFSSNDTEKIARYNDADIDLVMNKINRQTFATEYDKAQAIDVTSKRIALERIKEHPVRFISKSISIKPYLLWGNPGQPLICVSGIKNGIIKKGLLVYDFLFNKVIILLCGVLLVFNQNITNKISLFYILYALCVTGTQLLMECQPRYHFILLPMLGLVLGQSNYIDNTENFSAK